MEGPSEMTRSTDLADRVALVTGASYGLGRAIAATLAEAGARVVLTDVDPRLADAETAFRAAGHEVAAISLDVCDRGAFHDAVGFAIGQFGRLDILVNNAGYSRTTLPILDMDLAEWERSMNINVRGALFGIQEAARAMIQAGRGGRIVNIASTAAFRPFKLKSPYCVSKSALVALTRNAALELAEHRITVNAVAPGQTDTETTRLLQADPNAGEGMRRRAASIPLGVGAPKHIADAVAFFASDSAEHITGQTLLVDGGALMV
jgi:NAD(P)-dependent dehydrogenase (short-subunit alcohol dehydrogenase family)